MPADVDLLLLCGSLRGGSSNHAVLRTAADLAGAGRAAIYDGVGRLPHFNPDDDRDPLPPEVAEFRSQLGAATAVLISTPEYAGALPGSFKNALDWTIGGGEIYGKPVAWINTAGPAAPSGGADAHDSLRKVLGYAGADIVEQACARIPVARGDVGEDGLVHDERIRGEIARVVAALREHARAVAAS